MGYKICIVSEDKSYVEMVRVQLNNYGYTNIVICDDGVEALSLLKDNDKPNLALIDTVLPSTDGFKLCREMKNILGEHFKVILMSGLAETYNPAKAIQAGADEYVVKTFDGLLLMTAIKKAVSQNEIMQEITK